MSLALGACALVALLALEHAPSGMEPVPGGRYTPFYPVSGEAAQDVAPFWLDRRAVTNAEFLEFVREHERWRRSRVSRLFAEPTYLSSWAGDLELGSGAAAEQPVTFVSWFAASAYCKSVGARLPREAEWELAADPKGEDAIARAETSRRTLAFYARPRGSLPRVGSTPPNALGLFDLHGVIWEWIADWNASLALADDRQDGDPQSQTFCGGAALGASDPESYATFMRFAFRGSLEATYALHHLGFRCARSSAP